MFSVPRFFPLNFQKTLQRFRTPLKNSLLLCVFVIASIHLHASPDTASINRKIREATEFRYKDTKRSIRAAYEALDSSQQQQYAAGTARARYELAKAYFLLDDYISSLEHILECITVSEKLNDTVLSSDAYMALSNIYVMQNNPAQAQHYLRKSLIIKQRTGDKISETNIYNNIGYSHYRVHHYDSAMVYYRKSLAFSKSIGYERGVSNTLQNIGHIYNDTHQADSAEFYYRASLPLSVALHDLQLASKNYLRIAELSMARGEYDSAKVNLERGLVYAREIGISEPLCNYYKTLSLVYEKQNDTGNAYNFAKLYYTSLDSFNQSEASKKVGEMQFAFEMKRKNQEQELRNAANQASIARRNLVVWMSLAGLLLVLLALIYIYRNYRQKKSANLRLTEQNIIIEEQKKHVEEKNRDITDSINYAKKIQLALLKEKALIAQRLPEHFICYLPKDIVAGDFYWAFEKENNLYLAAADCTGHGVPGALLTMLGVSYLNEIVSVNELLSTAQILDKLRTRFIKELSQTGASGESKDGMDISIVCYNLLTRELNWSGANNPLWLITTRPAENFQSPNARITLTEKDELKLIEIKADKQPIGYHTQIAPFTDHHFHLQPGDKFYLFTDGYADQFGGPHGKKYKYQQLKELLLRICEQPFSEQRVALEVEFGAWKGGHEQLDDVCVVGIGLG